MTRIARSLLAGSAVVLFSASSATPLLHAQRPAPASSSHSSLEIASNRNVFLLVTAPNGLEAGYDSTVFGDNVNRIPSSSYSLGTAESASAAGNDRLINRKLEIGTPAPGRYLVQAIGGFAGRFVLRFKATDETGATAIREFSGATWPGHTVVYFVQYSPAPGAKFSVTRLTPFSHFSAGIDVSSFLLPRARVTASFTLGRGSKGIDPVTEPVSFQFSSYEAKVPAGSFIRNKDGAYSFDGTVENVRLKVRILREGANRFSFDLEAQGPGLRLSYRPVQLLLILGSNAGVARFTIPRACMSLRAPVHPVTPAGHLVRQFECEPVFWKQFEIGKKIVALHDRSVLPELKSLLFPQRTLFIPPSENELLAEENAAFIFASLGSDRGFQIIKDMLEDRSNPTQVRYSAARLFGELKDPRAVPILIPLLGDKAINYEIAWALGQIGDRSAIPVLIRTLDDKDPDMRVEAIYALEQLDAKQALPKLRMLLNDHEKIRFDGLIPVSTAARKAITKLERKP
jgi:hypothetical protein